MKLKILYLVAIVFCLFATSSLIAQSNDQRQALPLVTYNQNVDAPLSQIEKKQLQDVYGDKLQTYVLSKPQRLKALKNILRNRVDVIEISNPRDQKDCKLLSEISLFNYYVNDLKRDQFFNKNTFNPLKYNFDFYSRGSHMYRVDNTNYFIVIKSQHQQ